MPRYNRPATTVRAKDQPRSGCGNSGIATSFFLAAQIITPTNRRNAEITYSAILAFFYTSCSETSFIINRETEKARNIVGRSALQTNKSDKIVL